MKNSATNNSGWPSAVLFPSLNGSNWDLNVYFSVGWYAFAFNLVAQ